MILDSETQAFITVLGVLAPLQAVKQTSLITFGMPEDAPKPQIRPEIEQWVRGRVEFVTTGVEKCPAWFTKRLKQFDPLLRLRWDWYKDHWVIERLNGLDNLYHACGIWDRPLGEPLIEALRAGDMWKVDPKEHVRRVREASERQQRANDAKVADQLYGAVDAMTTRQVEEFVAASEAMATGEEIIPMGDDAKFMQKIHDTNKELLAKGEKLGEDERMCINPGMKPGKYSRKAR